MADCGFIRDLVLIILVLEGAFAGVWGEGIGIHFPLPSLHVMNLSVSVTGVLTSKAKVGTGFDQIIVEPSSSKKLD